VGVDRNGGTNPRFCAACLTLTPAAPRQLPIHAPRLVALAVDDVQAARRQRGRIQGDVGAATGHAGGHRDPARLPRLADDPGLVAVVAGVQHGVRDPGLREVGRQVFGITHRVGADQHGAALRAQFGGALGHGLPALLGGAKDQGGALLALAGQALGDAPHLHPGQALPTLPRLTPGAPPRKPPRKDWGPHV